MTAIVLGGCGNSGVSQEEYDKVVAERDSLKEQLDKMQGDEIQEAESSVIYDEKYVIEEHEFSLSLEEKEKKIILRATGSTEDREKSYLMFATFLAECKNIEKLLSGYSITITCGELDFTYMTVNDGYAIMGKNSDGSSTLKMPDWMPADISELTMEEDKIQQFLLDLDSKIMDFGTLSGYNMGVLVDKVPTGTNDSSMEEDTKPEAGNTVVYQDENIIITWIGLSGKESEYKIKFTVENLSEKTLNVQLRETSINGFMVDPTCSIEIAPGKKAIDGATIRGEDAENCPMSSVENIETKFLIYNDEDWADRYDTENIVILGPEN